MMPNRMLVKFKTNLGTNDAARFSLDHRECLGGASVDVPQSIGEALCKLGFATDETPAVPVTLKAVPVVDVVDVKEPELKAVEPAAKKK